MWVDRNGRNLTSQQVCDILSNHVGATYSVEVLHSTYRRGQIYVNGRLWFQRLS